MATFESRDLCDICNAKHKTSMAVKWCPECEEKLCEDCRLNHSLSKMLRHHTLIDIADYRNIPESILEIRNFCGQHNMKYTNLCPQHDQICCPACISGPHSGCKLLLLQDVIKTAKTSTLLQNMEDSLKSLTKNIVAIIKDRQTNLDQLQEQRKNIESKIKQIKETILKQLDAIERQIIEDLNSRVIRNTTQLESEIADLEIRLRKSEDLLNLTKTLVDFGSDLQTYIGCKTMEAEVAVETNSQQDLVNSGKLKRYRIELDMTRTDENLLKRVELFGAVKDDDVSVTFALTSDVEKQAQIMTLSSPVSIDDVKVVFKSKFNVSGYTSIYGCSLIPSGRVLLANYNQSCVVILKENCNIDIEKNIKVSSKPYDVTVIDNNTMAVSTTEDVKIINITTGKTEKTIPTGRCFGVEYYNRSLICCVPGKGIVSMDVTSSIMTTLVQDTEYNNWLHCTVHRDNIYVSRYADHTITCYSMKGDMLWEYKDTSVISYPFGIAVDKSSNVYVASYSNHRVVVLSPDGKRSRTLLTEKDGLFRPTALHLDRANKQLLVVNEKGPGYLFTL